MVLTCSISIERKEEQLEKTRSGLEVGDGPLISADLIVRGKTCAKDRKASIRSQCSFNPFPRYEAMLYEFHGYILLTDTNHSQRANESSRLLAPS